MKELNELYNVLDIILNYSDSDANVVAPMPLFSFEGLPGAGKSTQIELVNGILEKKYGKGCYIDLPTKSSIGKILKVLYSDINKWQDLRKENPWLNLILVSTDLRLAIQKAKSEGAGYALMSRGIISTYYYNLDAYENHSWEQQWSMMEQHMKAFYLPTAIFFLEINEEDAHERVVRRNRGALRKMDQVSQMIADRKKLLNYMSKFPNIPVHYINAADNVQNVTNNIIKEIERYF